MPKRFSDTQLLEKSWFLDLSIESKMIWFYLERSCDHAGIWEIDIPQMRRKLGCMNLSLVAFLDEINRDYCKTTGEPVTVSRVISIQNNSKLWLTGFVSEQYEKGLNGINTAVPAIKSAVNRLKDEGILEFALNEGFIRIQKQKPEAETLQHVQEVLPLSSYSRDTINEDEPNVLSLNILEAKGSEPFERDKDKDKDKDKVRYGSSSCSNNFLKEIGGVGGRTNAPPGFVEAPPPDDSASLVNNLFVTYWGKRPHTPHEEIITAQFILDYCYDEVNIAFGEAVNHNRFTLAYVKGVLQKRSVKLELLKAEENKKADLRRLSAQGAEERRQGVKLNLIESVYGNTGA